MPFVSKEQTKACFAKNDPKWDCHAWANETPDIKNLPERKVRFAGYEPKAKPKKRVRFAS